MSFKIQNPSVNQTKNLINYNNKVDTVNGAGQTISASTFSTSVVNTGTAYSVTLPNPLYAGQIKNITVADSTSGTSATITINLKTAPNFTTTNYTLNGIGDMIELFGTTQGWAEW